MKNYLEQKGLNQEIKIWSLGSFLVPGIQAQNPLNAFSLWYDFRFNPIFKDSLPVILNSDYGLWLNKFSDI